MLTAELILKTDSREKSFEMDEGRPLFAGRTMECDLHLPAPAVSRRHAVFMAKGGKCGVKDLDSSNGTYLNGDRLTKPMRLKDGDIVQIADFIIEFRMPQAQSFARADKTVVLSRAAAGMAAMALPAPVLSPPPAVADAPDGIDEPRAPDASHEPDPRFEPDAPSDELAAGDNSDSVEHDHFNVAEDAGDAPATPPQRASSDTSVRVKQPPAAILPEEGETASADAEPAGENAGIEQIAPTPDTAATLRLMPDPQPDPQPAPPPMPPMPPPPPRVQKLSEEQDVSPDEIGDGDGDAAFASDAAQSEEIMDKELLMTKAAAEAGLMGEFAPDVPEPAPGEARGDGDRSTSTSGSFASFAVDFPPLPEPDPYAIPIGDDFRQAIEARLHLYAFLSDLKEERDAILAGNSSLPDAVKSEIDRQNREMDKMPPADKAEDMITKRTARREDLKAKIKEAKEKGTAMPPRPSKEMRAAEDIAINQWSLIVKSQREALPAVFEAGYRITGREPLAKVLEEAKIDAKSMLGGASYVLALGVLLEETKYNRAFVRAKLSTMAPPDDKKQDKKADGGGKKRFGLFSKSAEEGDGEGEGEEGDGGEGGGESYEELASTEKQLGMRVAWITQETAVTEAALIKDFWDIYAKVALAFLPEHEKMPMPVRAFMRHGVIGFQKWWLKEDVRAHVIEDCTNNVRHSFEMSKTTTNVVYADEYLAAVMEAQCTPAMDENLEINERNSPNWKADKALRKLINSRSQTALLTELADSLGERIDKLDAEAAVLEDRIKNLLPGSKNYKGAKNELGQQRQALKVETSKLSKLRDKIRDETLASLKEVIEETDARFSSGELPMPKRDFLITRECEAVRKIGRLLANLKERFMPLVMRENFHPNTDAANDRDAILGEFADIERRDPSIFLENIIPSKKKANRVDLRISPAIVLLPAAGVLAFSWGPRQKPEDGRLAIPTCFIRPRLRERQLTYLLSDFRWDTAKAAAGMDVMNSDTIVAAFMGVRWDWRKRSREGREKGLIYTDQNDRTNWRRVYEAYMQTAYEGGKKLYNRNYDLYERIIGKYFDMPENVELLRK